MRFPFWLDKLICRLFGHAANDWLNMGTADCLSVDIFCPRCQRKMYVLKWEFVPAHAQNTLVEIKHMTVDDVRYELFP